jgi:hypothetical protein
MISGKGEALPASRPVARAIAAAEDCLLRETEDDPRTSEQLAVDLVQLRHAIDLLELCYSRDSAAFAATDEHELQGSVTAVDWIRHNCKMSGHAAAERVCAGEKLESLAASVEATVDGRIGYAHLALLARTAAWIEERAGCFQESALLAIAEDCSVSRFRHECHHARHAANPDDYAADEERVVDQRTMTMTLCEDGGYAFGGKLDSAGGAALRTALEPLARKSDADDDRHKNRRLADALVELAHHALDNGIVSQVANQRPHLQVTASFETLLGRIGSPAGEMEFSLPISAKTIERIACDCSLTRVLLNSDSAIIDVGRTRRLVAGSQTRALRARDRQCTWPGCDRPPSWTAAHHLKHWFHGGATNLGNLVLLCHRHHRMVHEGGWQLVKDDEDRIFTIPPAVITDRWSSPAHASLGRDLQAFHRPERGLEDGELGGDWHLVAQPPADPAIDLTDLDRDFQTPRVNAGSALALLSVVPDAELPARRPAPK